MSATACAEHLYVVGNGGVARYPLVHGVPATSPDQVYPGEGGPITVGRDGTLYTVIHNTGYYNHVRIDVFPPNSTKRSRQYAVAGGAQSLAVDDAGFVFAAYAFVDESLAPFGFGVRPALSFPSFGIEYYAPHKPGEQPIGVFGVPNEGSYDNVNIAFRPTGELFASVADYSGRVYIEVFDKPRRAPHLVRTIMFGADVATAISTEPSDRFFLLVQGFGSHAPSSVFTFPDDRPGHPAPLGMFTIASGPTYGMANYGANLFVSDPSNNAVYVFKKDSQGSPTPIDTLTISRPFDVAVGP